MAGSPIDANAFLDPAAFAKTLGTDDTIDLPAGFIERALTQLHAKGYGALARRAEKHDERYVRRLKRDAWNFDFSDAETSPRAELGLRDRMTPLGKLFIPAKSVKIGTGGAVAAPMTGRHGVGAATAWERLGELTEAAADSKRAKAVRAIIAQLTADKVAIGTRISLATAIADKAGLKAPKPGTNDDSVLDRMDNESLPSPIPLMTFAQNAGGDAGAWYKLMTRLPLLSYEDLNILSTYTDAVQMVVDRLGAPAEWFADSREVTSYDGELTVSITFDTGLGVSAIVQATPAKDAPDVYAVNASESYIGDHTIADLYETADDIGKFDNPDAVTAESVAAIVLWAGPAVNVDEKFLENITDYTEQVGTPKKKLDPYYRLINEIIAENDIDAAVLLNQIANLDSVAYGYMVNVPEEPKPPKKR